MCPCMCIFVILGVVKYSLSSHIHTQTFFVKNCMHYLVIAKLLQDLVVVTPWKWKLFQKKSIPFLLKQLTDTSFSHNGIVKDL